MIVRSSETLADSPILSESGWVAVLDHLGRIEIVHFSGQRCPAGSAVSLRPTLVDPSLQLLFDFVLNFFA
jgi:hypothetical protein